MSKVSIYTTHYNRVDFLLLQYNQLIKCCIDNFQYIVINNGINDDIKEQISSICKHNNIKEIVVPHSNVPDLCSANHIEALRYAYKNYISIDDADIRVVMDNDVVPFKSFSFYNIIKDKQMAGFFYNTYSSAIFTMYSKEVNLTDFNISGGFGDSGSGTYHLLDKYSIEWVDHTAPMNNREANYIFSAWRGALPYLDYGYQFIAGYFIHYYRNSGWDNGSPQFQIPKYKFFIHFLENVDKYNPKLDSRVHYSTAHIDKSYRHNQYKFNIND
jgi:hypothetical protein